MAIVGEKPLAAALAADPAAARDGAHRRLTLTLSPNPKPNPNPNPNPNPDPNPYPNPNPNPNPSPNQGDRRARGRHAPRPSCLSCFPNDAALVSECFGDRRHHSLESSLSTLRMSLQACTAP